MPLTTLGKKALAELKRIVKERYGLIDFCVFGSKARGEDSLDSDVDLMIELAETTPRVESDIDKLVFKINLKYDCFITTVIFGKAELEEGPMGQSPLYMAIEREGVRL